MPIYVASWSMVAGNVIWIVLEMAQYSYHLVTCISSIYILDYFIYGSVDGYELLCYGVIKITELFETLQHFLWVLLQTKKEL